MHVDITLPITINSKQLRVRSLCVVQDFRFLSSFPFKKKKQNRKFSVLKENFKIRKSSEYPRLYVHRMRLIILLIPSFLRCRTSGERVGEIENGIRVRMAVRGDENSLRGLHFLPSSTSGGLRTRRRSLVRLMI